MKQAKTYAKCITSIKGGEGWEGHVADVVALVRHDLKFHFETLLMQHVDISRVDFAAGKVKVCIVAPCTDGAANVVKSASQEKISPDAIGGGGRGGVLKQGSSSTWTYSSLRVCVFKDSLRATSRNQRLIMCIPQGEDHPSVQAARAYIQEGLDELREKGVHVTVKNPLAIGV